MPESFNKKTQNYSSETDQRRINHKPTRSQVFMPSGWEIRLYTVIFSHLRLKLMIHDISKTHSSHMKGLKSKQVPYKIEHRSIPAELHLH
jgi:hypothetical protein